ncbi:MAG TPA: hypothetical protein VF788_07570 [Pseudonocardiaceae bacterium]
MATTRRLFPQLAEAQLDSGHVRHDTITNITDVVPQLDHSNHYLAHSAVSRRRSPHVNPAITPANGWPIQAAKVVSNGLRGNPR